MTTDDQTILFSVEQSCGRIEINRPKALNALSGAMCHDINQQLMAWADDSAISHIVISACEGKAFCAGGDVRALIPMLKQNHAHARAYFETEYQLDLIINTYPKPVVVFANGLTMGGGAGVLMNAAVQIITDRMDFAMPETAIGLFPDVAASVFLRRAPLPIAAFLGITGWRIGAGDMKALGILRPETGLVVSSAERDAVLAALIGLDQTALETPGLSAVKKALDDAVITPPDTLQDTPIFDARDWIIAHFSKPDLRAIRDGLDQDDHPMAEACRHAIDTRAPLSMAVTHHLMTAPRFSGLSVPDALSLDNTMACRITLRPDFAEGVRALLIDKDNAPKWQPASIDDVTPEMLETIFTETDRIALDYPQGYTPNHS